jgi:predicted  nucleic acid-binding Zn-ribbon protein
MDAENARLRAEAAQLRADLQEQRDNRNRDLRAFSACIKERDGLRSEVSRLEEVLDAVRNWRLCMSVASEMASFERQLLAALEQYQAYWTARERAAQGQGEGEQR